MQETNFMPGLRNLPSIVEILSEIIIQTPLYYQL